MLIDIQNGVVQTSKGDYFNQSSIYRINLYIESVTSKKFIIAEVDKVPDQKIFYSEEFGYDSRYWSIIPENEDLYLDSEHSDAIEKIITTKSYEHKVEYTKVVEYEFINEEGNPLGTHSYSKTYEDKLYLLAQWAIDLKSIKDLPFQLLQKSSEKEYIK